MEENKCEMLKEAMQTANSIQQQLGIIQQNTNEEQKANGNNIHQVSNGYTAIDELHVKLQETTNKSGLNYKQSQGEIEEDVNILEIDATDSNKLAQQLPTEINNQLRSKGSGLQEKDKDDPNCNANILQCHETAKILADQRLPIQFMSREPEELANLGINYSAIYYQSRLRQQLFQIVADAGCSQMTKADDGGDELDDSSDTGNTKKKELGGRATQEFILADGAAVARVINTVKFRVIVPADYSARHNGNGFKFNQSVLNQQNPTAKNSVSSCSSSSGVNPPYHLKNHQAANKNASVRNQSPVVVAAKCNLSGGDSQTNKPLQQQDGYGKTVHAADGENRHQNAEKVRGQSPIQPQIQNAGNYNEIASLPKVHFKASIQSKKSLQSNKYGRTQKRKVIFGEEESDISSSEPPSPFGYIKGEINSGENHQNQCGIQQNLQDQFPAASGGGEGKLNVFQAARKQLEMAHNQAKQDLPKRMEEIAAWAVRHNTGPITQEAPCTKYICAESGPEHAQGIIQMPETSIILVKDQPYLSLFCNQQQLAAFQSKYQKVDSLEKHKKSAVNTKEGGSVRWLDINFWEVSFLGLQKKQVLINLSPDVNIGKQTQKDGAQQENPIGKENDSQNAAVNGEKHQQCLGSARQSPSKCNDSDDGCGGVLSLKGGSSPRPHGKDAPEEHKIREEFRGETSIEKQFHSSPQQSEDQSLKGKAEDQFHLICRSEENQNQKNCEAAGAGSIEKQLIFLNKQDGSQQNENSGFVQQQQQAVQPKLTQDAIMPSVKQSQQQSEQQSSVALADGGRKCSSHNELVVFKQNLLRCDGEGQDANSICDDGACKHAGAALIIDHHDRHYGGNQGNDDGQIIERQDEIRAAEIYRRDQLVAMSSRHKQYSSCRQMIKADEYLIELNESKIFPFSALQIEKHAAKGVQPHTTPTAVHINEHTQHRTPVKLQIVLSSLSDYLFLKTFLEQQCLVSQPKISSIYQFVSPIGRGAQAQVDLYQKINKSDSASQPDQPEETAFWAEQTNTNNDTKHQNVKFAVKSIRLPPHQIPGTPLPMAAQLAMREINFYRELKICENIAQIEQVFISDDPVTSQKIVSLVMRFAQYGSINSLFKDTKKLQEDQARSIIAQLLLTVDLMHRKGIIHRDIKADNILLLDKKDLQIQITDLGFACRADDQKQITLKCGTPGYVCPAVLRSHPFTTKADIFSIGAFFYNIVTGQKLCKGSSAQEILWNNLIINPQEAIDQNVTEVSSNCKDLLKLMLNPKTPKRPTAEECLQHPWFLKDREALKGSLFLNKNQRLLATLYHANKLAGSSHIPTAMATTAVASQIPAIIKDVDSGVITTEFANFISTPNYYEKVQCYALPAIGRGTRISSTGQSLRDTSNNKNAYQSSTVVDNNKQRQVSTFSPHYSPNRSPNGGNGSEDPHNAALVLKHPSSKAGGGNQLITIIRNNGEAVTQQKMRQGDQSKIRSRNASLINKDSNNGGTGSSGGLTKEGEANVSLNIIANALSNEGQTYQLQQLATTLTSQKKCYDNDLHFQGHSALQEEDEREQMALAQKYSQSTKNNNADYRYLAQLAQIQRFKEQHQVGGEPGRQQKMNGEQLNTYQFKHASQLNEETSFSRSSQVQNPYFTTAIAIQPVAAAQALLSEVSATNHGVSAGVLGSIGGHFCYNKIINKGREKTETLYKQHFERVKNKSNMDVNQISPNQLQASSAAAISIENKNSSIRVVQSNAQAARNQLMAIRKNGFIPSSHENHMQQHMQLIAQLRPNSNSPPNGQITQMQTEKKAPPDLEQNQFLQPNKLPSNAANNNFGYTQVMKIVLGSGEACSPNHLSTFDKTSHQARFSCVVNGIDASVSFEQQLLQNNISSTRGPCQTSEEMKAQEQNYTDAMHRYANNQNFSVAKGNRKLAITINKISELPPVLSLGEGEIDDASVENDEEVKGIRDNQEEDMEFVSDTGSFDDEAIDEHITTPKFHIQNHQREHIKQSERIGNSDPSESVQDDSHSILFGNMDEISYQVGYGCPYGSAIKDNQPRLNRHLKRSAAAQNPCQYNENLNGNRIGGGGGGGVNIQSLPYAQTDQAGTQDNQESGNQVSKNINNAQAEHAFEVNNRHGGAVMLRSQGSKNDDIDPALHSKDEGFGDDRPAILAVNPNQYATQQQKSSGEQQSPQKNGCFNGGATGKSIEQKIKQRVHIGEALAASGERKSRFMKQNNPRLFGNNVGIQ